MRKILKRSPEEADRVRRRLEKAANGNRYLRDEYLFFDVPEEGPIIVTVDGKLGARGLMYLATLVEIADREVLA